MMLDSIDNGPLVYPTIEEDRQTRPKKYSELTEAQQLQDNCDVQATNIILHGLSPDVYVLVNHQELVKDIWDRVKLLMKGTELSYQERKCKLYNLFDKMTMQQVQVNTKFLNALPLEWSKFVTDVNLEKSLYTTNYDQLYAYLSQHERHANEVLSPQPYISSSVTQQSQTKFPQLDSGLDVPIFQQGEDLIDYINKAMAFLFVMVSRFPPSNNQLRTSSNPRNQATIQDGRVIVQQVQGRQTHSFASIRNKGIATTSRGNFAAGQPRGKLMLVKAQEAGQTLDEEQLAFIAELRIEEAPVSQQTIHQNSAFQTKDLDAYDSDCDDISSTKAVLMEIFQAVIHKSSLSDSNIIPYSQYLQELQDASIQDTNSSAPNDLLVLSLVEEMTDQKHDLIFVIDDEETLILEEESRSKMLDKQNDPISIKHKINISPIDYSKLNNIKEDFGKHFLTQKELSAEQAFWLKHSNHTFDTSVESHTPVRIEAPSELPKVSLVNESLKKLKYHLASFDKVVKKRTTSDAITVDEITEVQNVFNQMEADVDQCSIDKNDLEIQIKQLRIDNDQLLNQIIPIRRIHQGRYGVSVPALTKDHIGIKLNRPYPEDQYVVLEIRNKYNILEDIKRGPYSKKSPICRIQSLDTPMGDPKMTMEEYIKLEEEKARRHGRVFNWQTAIYGKIRVNDDLYNHRSMEAEFLAIVIDDAFAPKDILP
ncbi:hypothetical protein Tco_0909461 [Tanacetum coccineum]|uniref:Integrase, catalytic region, zinc finger, CCHC-type, peptidase aspartic, catalytic n=1 Tax=Tanacetum coccineum TaxID=301880 RepID=A0ABQ5CQ21_9ASTR